MSWMLLLLMLSLLAPPQAEQDVSEGPADREVANKAVLEFRDWDRAPRDFVVFEEMFADGKPDLSAGGIEPIVVVQESRLREGRDPTAGNIARGAARVMGRGQVVCVNIESLPTNARRADDAEVQAAHEELANVLRHLRAFDPSTRLGIYALMPVRDYWTPHHYEQAKQRLLVARWRAFLSGDPADERRVETARAELADVQDRMAAWRRANDRFTYTLGPDDAHDRGLADEVDVIFPSLYFFYDDPEGNERYARHNLAEARRYGKPVYAFVRPIWHESNKEIGRRPVPVARVLAAYRVIRAEADGVVIWDGFKRPWSRTHAEHAAVWQVLRDEPTLSDAQVLARVARHPWVTAAGPDVR